MPFVTDNSQLPFPKSDREPLGAGKDPTQHVTASEWNKVCQSEIDLRAWAISGTYHGFDASTTMPNVQMGLSGTDGAFWLSSSLDTYLTTTSSAGLVSKKVAVIDSQGVLSSADTISAIYVTASLGIKTVDLEVTRNAAFSSAVSSTYLTASVGTKTRDLEVTRNLTVANESTFTGPVTASLDLRIGRNLDLVGSVVGGLTGSKGVRVSEDLGVAGKTVLTGALEVISNAVFAAPSTASIDFKVSRNLDVIGNSLFVSLTGSGGAKVLDLEVTRNATFNTVNALTASTIKSTTDLEATRNLLIGGNSNFVSLTGSGGAKALDLDVTRNISGVNLTATFIKSTQDMSNARNAYFGGIESGTDVATAVLAIGDSTRTACTAIGGTAGETPCFVLKATNGGLAVGSLKYDDNSNLRLKINGLQGIYVSGSMFGEGWGGSIPSNWVITGSNGNFFDVTGTTTISYMRALNGGVTFPVQGTVLCLKFNASLTVENNAASPPANSFPFRLAGAANFSATADDTLTVRLQGTTWWEVARSVN